MSVEASALLLTWIAIALLAFGMSGLLRQIRALQGAQAFRRVTVGPRVGSTAPALEGVNPDWHAAIFLFVDAHCSSCGTALEELNEMAAANRGLAFLAVFKGASNGFRERGGVRILEGQDDAHTRFRIPLTPFAVAVTANGTIADAAAVGSPMLLRVFVDHARTRLGQTVAEEVDA